MRMMTQALLALGFVGAMAVSTPATTKAQGVTIYGPGVEVDIGRTRQYPYRYNRYPYYRDGYNAYGYAPGYRYPNRWNTYNGCPPRYSIQDGVCKPYRGY